MPLAIILALLLALLYGPQLWARWILARHHQPRDDYPGTGAELARHLLNKFGLDAVTVEQSPQGDHYDPLAKSVRLTPDKYAGKSLTAITVAAHEVGHAIQDQLQYRPLQWRSRLVALAQVAEKLGAGAMVLLPIVTAITRSPGAAAILFTLGLASMGLSTVVHIVTLPVEFDASFKRALPLLKAGHYIDRKDEGAARAILRACALTYVAASLASLFNFWRWLRLLRR